MTTVASTESAEFVSIAAGTSPACSDCSVTLPLLLVFLWPPIGVAYYDETILHVVSMLVVDSVKNCRVIFSGEPSDIDVGSFCVHNQRSNLNFISITSQGTQSFFSCNFVIGMLNSGEGVFVQNIRMNSFKVVVQS